MIDLVHLKATGDLLSVTGKTYGEQHAVSKEAYQVSGVLAYELALSFSQP